MNTKLLFAGILYSANVLAVPVLTFNPLTPTSFNLSATGTAIVQYSLQNQSKKTHTFVIAPIKGVTQIQGIGTCPNQMTLAWQQSCTLMLQINGSQVSGAITGGPRVCQQGPGGQPDPLQCYQPAAANVLNVLSTPSQQIFYVGTQSGNVFYSQNLGTTWTAAVTAPDSGNAVNSVFAAGNSTLYAGVADGLVYYSTNNGTTWNHCNTIDGSAVNTVFSYLNLLFAGTQNGSLYYSINNGTSWNATSQPDGSAVDSFFANNTGWYAGTANGNVYYSTNNGVTWSAIDGQPDGSAVTKLFIANHLLYANTANEYVYSTSALSGGGTWTGIAQSAYSLYVNPLNGILYCGTQSGYVYSITAGQELGFVTYSPINSIYVLN